MANPPCMSDDGNQSIFVGTFLLQGEPVAVCAECIGPWAAAVVQASTGVDLSSIFDEPASETGIVPDGQATVDEVIADIEGEQAEQAQAEPEPVQSGGGSE